MVKASPFFIKDAGASGVYGFSQGDNTNLCQRFISKFGHSDYLHVLNFTENWFPFLKGGNPPKDRPSLNAEVNWRFWFTRIMLLILLIGIVIAGIRLTERFKRSSNLPPQPTVEQPQEPASQNTNQNSNENAPFHESKNPGRPEKRQSLANYLSQARKFLKQGNYEEAIRVYVTKPSILIRKTLWQRQLKM